MERVASRYTDINSDTPIDLDNMILINEYLKDAECIGLTDRTLENYNSCLKLFSKFVRKSLIDIDIEDLKRFKTYLQNRKNRYNEKYSVKTISRYFSAIQSFYEYLEFEDYVDKNPMSKFRKRYLSSFNRAKYSRGDSKRKLISVEEMSMLINSIIDPLAKAVVTTLCKTGVRRQELVNIDIDDIDWSEQCIHLKPTLKRSNLDIFFDDECSRILRRWMISRENRKNNGTKALFINERGGRLGRNGIYELVVKYATKVGLHDPNSRRIQDRFTTHCTRHWYSTHLYRNGMKREYNQRITRRFP